MDVTIDNDKYLELPELIELMAFGGDFNRYLEAVYEMFKNDFIRNRPVFRGIRLGLKKYPTYNGKEATFWHMTSEGKDEQNRLAD